MFEVKDRINNRAGYNCALGSKKGISRHTCVLKDELNIAADNALGAVMSKPGRQSSRKYQKLRKRQDELMSSYKRGNVELFNFSNYHWSFLYTKHEPNYG